MYIRHETGGVMKWSYCYYLEVDNFPIIALLNYLIPLITAIFQQLLLLF